MKKRSMIWISIVAVLFAFWGCGSSAAATGGSDARNHFTMPHDGTCGEGEFLRIKTGQCFPIQKRDWGFVAFTPPKENLYRLNECSETALRDLIDQIPSAGGKVILPECGLTLHDTIALSDNTILEGAGMGKTVINVDHENDILSLRGRNIVVRGITFDGQNRALGGIVGTNNRGNILIDGCEIKNLRGSGIYLVTNTPQADTQITLRSNAISRALHAIVVKTYASAKMEILSNHLFNNREYGIDMSMTSDFEVAGNYMHDNHFAGAKSPKADRIYYHHNDIHFNGTKENREDSAGIIYMGSNSTAKIYIEYNDLSYNYGLAFATWDGHFAYLLLRDNNVTGSEDSNHYNIRATGVGQIDIYGDHGSIWAGDGNEGRIHQYP